METKLILGEVTCGLSQAVASLAGDSIKKAIIEGGVGKSEDLRTDEVTLGWKKNLLGKWKKKEVLTTILIDTDKFKSDILRRDDMSNNDKTKANEILQSKITELQGGLSRNEEIFNISDSAIPFADEGMLCE